VTLTGTLGTLTAPGRLEAILPSGRLLHPQDVNDLTPQAAAIQTNNPPQTPTVPPTEDTLLTIPIRTVVDLLDTTPNIDHPPELLQPWTKTQAAVRQALRTHRPVTVLADLATAAIAAARAFGSLQFLGRTNAVIPLTQATVHLPNIHNLYGPSTTVPTIPNLHLVDPVAVAVPLNSGKPIGMVSHRPIQTLLRPCKVMSIQTHELQLSAILIKTISANP